MAKKKKVVTSTTPRSKSPTKAATRRRAAASAPARPTEPMLYGRVNYYMLAVSAGVIILGLIVMAGGSQDPNEWNPDEIYSFSRTVLAPILILAGLGLGIYNIFTRPNS